MPNEYRKKARELAKLAQSQRDPELRAELRELSAGYTLLAKEADRAIPIGGRVR